VKSIAAQPPRAAKATCIVLFACSVCKLTST